MFVIHRPRNTVHAAPRAAAPPTAPSRLAPVWRPPVRRPTRYTGAMLLLLACADPDTGKEADDAGRAWTSSFSWTPAEPLACPAEVPGDDLVAAVLATRDLDLGLGMPESIFEEFGGYVADDPARRSWYHPLMADLSAVPCTGATLAARASLAFEDHPLTTLVADAAWMMDAPLTVGGPLPAPGLAEALAELGAAEADLGAVPAAVQELAAGLLAVAAEAAARREETVAALGIADRELDDVFSGAPETYVPTTHDNLEPEEDVALLAPEPAAMTPLYEGAARLAQALDELDPAGAASAEAFSFRVQTDLGLVLLSGGGDDEHDPEVDAELDGPILLMIDTGGDDVWRVAAGATASEDAPVALALDLGGDDVYAYVEVASDYDDDTLLPSDEGGRYAGDDSYGSFSKSQRLRQGAATLGAGFLLDLGGGADQYRSLRYSQGYGALGVGLAYDDGGDDLREAEISSQGVGLAGIGLLVDAGGADQYLAWSEAQGMAFAAGFGALVDLAGNDAYELVVSPVLYPWFDGWGTNLGMGQGAAYGYRVSADDDSVELAGGLGLLVDAEGDDNYRAGVDAQGLGYWMGFGVLADGAGDDHYDGVQYVQAVAQHFGLATFLEGGGDDVYQDSLLPVSSLLGLGHDYGVAVFVEEDGTDVYSGPDRSIGAGKCHGLGLFVDRDGTDHYETQTDRGIGWATDWDVTVGDCGDETGLGTYGFFVDGGGVDQYLKPDPSGYGDDRGWVSDDPEDDDALELSAGIDAEGDCFAHAW